MLVLGVQHSDSNTFFRFFSLGYCRILSIPPCAMQWIPVGYLIHV